MPEAKNAGGKLTEASIRSGERLPEPQGQCRKALGTGFLVPVLDGKN
jgi:hypothetical protein